MGALRLPAAGAALGKLVPAAVLATTAVRFATTGVYEVTAGSGWKTTAGVVGVLPAVIAVYAALALLLEDVRRATLLPLLRVGAGARSLHGNLDDQLDRIEREPGIREQL